MFLICQLAKHFNNSRLRAMIKNSKNDHEEENEIFSDNYGSQRKKRPEKTTTALGKEIYRQETFNNGQTQENDSTQDQETSNTSQTQQLHSIQELTQQD
ncbi:28328_t:CDS:2 [Gigaspora margarita]|uniref:28328_t:CDS:1 n=1 Tax=Gigaspora margarita TaxID=4874 RepID=A0ABN7V6K7_GIGMA|nr:28328_t:CDS:2 [Gigaspora margarita]